MNRRSLLLGIGGILASATAPAIITQPMKIVAAPKDIWKPAWYSPAGLVRGKNVFIVASTTIRDGTVCWEYYNKVVDAGQNHIQDVSFLRHEQVVTLPLRVS